MESLYKRTSNDILTLTNFDDNNYEETENSRSEKVKNIFIENMKKILVIINISIEMLQIIFLFMIYILFNTLLILNSNSISNQELTYSQINFSLLYMTVITSTDESIQENILFRYNNCIFDKVKMTTLTHDFNLCCYDIQRIYIVNIVINIIFCLTLISSIHNIVSIILYKKQVIKLKTIEKFYIIKFVLFIINIFPFLIFLFASGLTWLENARFSWHLFCLLIPFNINLFLYYITRKFIYMIVFSKSEV